MQWFPFLLRMGIIARSPWLRGKKIIIGITDCSPTWEAISQTQLVGRITAVNGNGIRVLLEDGGIYDLPPDPRALRRAPKGQYRLRSNGRVINDPDYLFTYERIQHRNFEK